MVLYTECVDARGASHDEDSPDTPPPELGWVPGTELLPRTQLTLLPPHRTCAIPGHDRTATNGA